MTSCVPLLEGYGETNVALLSFPVGTFLGFAVICVLASIFVYLVLPETKDKSLEEVELLFMSKTKREAAQTRLDRAGGGGGRGVSLELDVKPEAEVKVSGTAENNMRLCCHVNISKGSSS